MKRNKMMKQKIITGIIGVLALLNLNCGNSKEVIEIKPRVIYPAVIEDTIKAAVNNDSVIIGIETGHPSGHSPAATGAGFQQQDTNIIVKYFPKYKKFYIKVKPDSVIVFDTLKTIQTIEKNIETPLLSKMGLVMAGVIITIIGLYLLKK
jgi:hypothetical protein